MSVTPASNIIYRGPNADFNLITNGSIFVEQPFKVLKCAFSDKNVSFKDRLFAVAKAIQAVALAIITWEFTNHVGHLVKEPDGRILRIHISGGKPVKEEAPEYILKGCDWLIPNDEKIKDESIGSSNMQELYGDIKLNAEEATNPEYKCKSDVIGTLLTPFNRKSDHNLSNYKPETGQKFTSTEFVARVWKKYCVEVAHIELKLNKILPSDMIKYADKTGLWTVYKAL